MTILSASSPLTPKMLKINVLGEEYEWPVGDDRGSLWVLYAMFVQLNDPKINQIMKGAELYLAGCNGKVLFDHEAIND